MNEDDGKLVEIFLRLKAKAAQDVLWNDSEQSIIEQSLKKKGEIGILAACCVFVSRSQRSKRKDFDVSFELIRDAIQQTNLSRYVEISIYEALIYLEAAKLKMFRDALISFIKRSLNRRVVNLDNTIFLIGKLARTGDSEALALLKLLTKDSDEGIKKNACMVIQGIQ